MEGDVVLTDPRALRALAHPTRLALLERLADGPATATTAGEAVGISPSAASYHLRALARWGLVADAGGGRGRERPWRAVAGFAFEPADHEGPGAEAAVSALTAQLIASGDRATTRFLEAERGVPKSWRRASRVSNTMLLATPAEAEELGRRLDELLAPFLRSTRSDVPETARPLRLLVRLFPHDPARL